MHEEQNEDFVLKFQIMYDGSRVPIVCYFVSLSRRNFVVSQCLAFPDCDCEYSGKFEISEVDDTKSKDEDSDEIGRKKFLFSQFAMKTVMQSEMRLYLPHCMKLWRKLIVRMEIVMKQVESSFYSLKLQEAIVKRKVWEQNKE